MQLPRDDRHRIHLTLPEQFGTFLKMLRDRNNISQGRVAALLPSIGQRKYSKFEGCERVPTFDELPKIYKALRDTGVEFTYDDRTLFLRLAKQMLEAKKTYKVQLSDSEWEDLRLQLAKIDQLPLGEVQPTKGYSILTPSTLRMETSHLLGRDAWLQNIFASLQKVTKTKIIIIKGPPGIGKTSELHRIANHFLQSIPRHHVVLCNPPSLDQEIVGSDVALELLLGDILEVVSPNASLPTKNLSTRIKFVLSQLANADRPVLILLDNGEHLLGEQGNLTSSWKQFLSRFLQARHNARCIIATKEWSEEWLLESQLVKHMLVPYLTVEEGVQVLNRLGLGDLPLNLLQQVVEDVNGIPQCLEWVVKLIQEPLLRDTWSSFEDEEMPIQQSRIEQLTQLLEDDSLFGGAIATQVEKLLERVIKRLSLNAIQVLQELSVAPAIPLGVQALKALYNEPAPLQELRDTSLLLAYPKRVQLLPMVAVQVRKHLSAAQIQSAEDRLIQALTHWLHKGIINTREKGVVVTEVALLMLRRSRILAASEWILSHGWLSSHVGQMMRLAERVQGVLKEPSNNTSPENELEVNVGKTLLRYYLSSYLGKNINTQKRAEDYTRIRATISSGQVKVDPLMEVHLVDHIMQACMSNNQFEEANALLEACFQQMQPLLARELELHATLLMKQAVLYNRWGAYARSLNQQEEAQQLRSRSITLYEESRTLLLLTEKQLGEGSLQQSTVKKKLATCLNNLAYQLNIAGHFEEALRVVNTCLDLKKDGYADRESLAATYGEKSQILAALGRFQEALLLDERARSEIRQYANSGDTMSQEEIWVFQVNQGRLLLLMGKIDEAECLLREAEPKIHERRRHYQVIAQEALQEIKKGREESENGSYQLDWRWVKRFRELSAYDAYWWWAHGGPFTQEEQIQWNQFSASKQFQEKQDQLRSLLVVSRDRELASAFAEGREPELRYPAIDILDIRHRIQSFLELSVDISRDEPNAIVRRLYKGAIEDEICFLRMIEATFEGDNKHFWELNQLLNPPPTREEMKYALLCVKQIVIQGLQREDTEELSKLVMSILQERMHFVLDITEDTMSVQKVQQNIMKSLIPTRMVSACTAKRFFESVLQGNGFIGWKVILDTNVNGPRVESGLRTLFLPNSPISLEGMREYFSHELLGHITRSVAGERSLLGLLGMGTKGYMPTEEGFADYHERHVAKLYEQAFDDSGTWLGTLAVGMACGIVMEPQTFLSLFTFFEPFLLLYRLLWRSDEEKQTAEQRARKNAITRCLRTFRGVPDLKEPGVCFTKDVVYLRGLWTIEREVLHDESILDRLSVGKVAFNQLSDLRELGIVTSPMQSLRKIAYHSDFDTYVLSFESQEDIL